MAELKFEAPLAQFESEEWVDFSDYTTSASSTVSDSSNLMVDSCSSAELCSDDARNSNHQSSSASSTSSSPAHQLTEVDNTEAIKQQEAVAAAMASGNVAASVLLTGETASAVADNFTETYSGSLEDLVNTFDDKITKCFCNFDESVEKLAPVQVRSQEEIMNECQ
ncbi:hypothetical protein B566_EDAN001879 [Ephemera danica]|nr:hypothetical protein B566_EDAN001879 [Ephemera danica]